MTFRPHRWTYSGKPSGSPVDQVRFLVGDTNPDDKQLDDCEIEWLIDENGSVLSAAICAALGIAAYYARAIDSEVYGDKSALSQKYIDLANELKKKRSRRGVKSYAGGIRSTDKLSRASDSSLVRPEFTRDMMKQLRIKYGC